ncbi:MAG TPA: universal stress protein [Candidatus Acidoferrales bacterium]|nr:universal stress protein [Candidatus Acidoferrales bacterium]
METGRLLACVDGSRASMEAARVAIDLAKRWNSVLRALYVVETNERDSEIDGTPDAGLTARLHDSGRAILAHVAEMGAAAGVAVVQGLLEGVPFDAIIDDARAWKADLIIMGRTGRTGPGRALLGSEAERVLEFTDRPVLIVPTLQAQTSGSRR